MIRFRGGDTTERYAGAGASYNCVAGKHKRDSFESKPVNDGSQRMGSFDLRAKLKKAMARSVLSRAVPENVVTYACVRKPNE